MAKNVFFDAQAEKEAVDIGKKFMNSTDVVGDMSRAYGKDLSAVRLHTDESAAKKTAERGVDAFSTGKDVFFGRGVFDRSDPASRGLLAHELSHSLQQGVGGDLGGMTRSAPMGAEQGGLISWFREWRERRRQKKEQQALEEQNRAAENARLDEEDAKFARWDAEGRAHRRDLRTNGMLEEREGAEEDGGGFDVNLTELAARAGELGWVHSNGNSMGGDEGMVENFFREISGAGVNGTTGEDGQKRGVVSTAKRSQQEMMDLFNNHDEATTLRTIQPLLDMNIGEFTQKYPLHQMTPEQRREIYPRMNAELMSMVGIKQWAEKYAFPILSEANQQRLDSQIQKFEQVTKWAYIMRMPEAVSFSEFHDMNLMNADDVISGSAHLEEMQERQKQVESGLGAGGCVLGLEEFKQIMGDKMPKGRDIVAVKQLMRQFPGMSFNQETNEVTCPIPLEELKGLAAGNKSMLKSYADRLRGMDWRKEDGGVRRAGEYDATSAEFVSGFDEDAAYFGQMKNTAAALDLFGRGYVGKQKDAGDLAARSKMAANTYDMMNQRAGDIRTPMSLLFERQYDGVQNRTWIKRLLNRKRKQRK